MSILALEILLNTQGTEAAKVIVAVLIFALIVSLIWFELSFATVAVQVCPCDWNSQKACTLNSSVSVEKFVIFETKKLGLILHQIITTLEAIVLIAPLTTVVKTFLEVNIIPTRVTKQFWAKLIRPTLVHEEFHKVVALFTF